MSESWLSTSTSEQREHERVILVQIATVEQGAIAKVQSYPYVLTVDGFFEVLRAHEQAPSKEDLAAASVANDMTADWDYLENYLASITPENAVNHVPLLSHNLTMPKLSNMVSQLQKELLRKP